MKVDDLQVALITGGASGIGAAMVRHFAARGFNVLAGDVAFGRPVSHSQIETQPIHSEILSCELDVRDEMSVTGAIDLAYSKYGRLDVVCDVAGVQVEKPLHETSLAEWEELHGVNLRGVFFVTKQAVIRWLETGEPGRIVNIASIAGMQADPAVGAYSVSKHGVIGLTRVTAATYGPNGIRCNSISPGSVLTPILERWFEGMGGGSDLRKRLERLYPSRRLFEPIEIARLAFFLASDDSSAINGANVPADGGLTATVLESALAAQ